MPILVTVLGFLWWWPLGLLLLALFIGRGKFGCRRHWVHAGEAPMFEVATVGSVAATVGSER